MKKKTKPNLEPGLGCLRHTVLWGLRIPGYTPDGRLQNEHPGNALPASSWIFSHFIKGKPRLEGMGVEERMCYGLLLI